MRTNSTNYFYDAAGHKFESDVVDVVIQVAKKEWGVKSIAFSTVQQDRFEGTDLFVLGVPIDITLAFAKKNRMRKLGYVSFDGVTVEYGIRFGNAKAAFKTPVLVIGAETAIGITKANMYVAMDTIKNKVKDILDTGMDYYFNAVEA